MTNPFVWLLDLLDRARTAAEATSLLEWKSKEREHEMAIKLATFIGDKLNDGPPKPPKPPRIKRQLIRCSECLLEMSVTQAGHVTYHGPYNDRCPGSGRPVALDRTLGGVVKV